MLFDRVSPPTTPLSQPLRELKETNAGIKADAWKTSAFGGALSADELPPLKDNVNELNFGRLAPESWAKLSISELTERLKLHDEAKAQQVAAAQPRDEDERPEEDDVHDDRDEDDDVDGLAKKQREQEEDSLVVLAESEGLDPLGIVHRLAKVKDKHDRRILSWAAGQSLSLLVVKDKKNVGAFRQREPGVRLTVLPWVPKHVPNHMEVDGAVRLASLYQVSEDLTDAGIDNAQLVLESLFGDSLLFPDEAAMLAYRGALDDHSQVPTLYAKKEGSRLLFDGTLETVPEKLPLMFRAVEPEPEAEVEADEEAEAEADEE